MGVNGYDLLNLSKVKGIHALMLTAHALSPEHLEKSIGGGACCYLPKEEQYFNDVGHLYTLHAVQLQGRG